MEKFEVNPKIFATGICFRGRSYRKGVVYDPVVERIPPARYEEMMKQKMGEIFFFVEINEGSAQRVAGSAEADPNRATESGQV